MEYLRFIQIEKENDRHFEIILSLWIDHINELDGHRNRKSSVEEITVQLKKRVNIQGMRRDLHFEICYFEDTAIGLAMFAIDLGGIKGLIDAGYGFIMDYYISPNYRRRGYGRELFEHIQTVFRSHGAEYIYLTPDPVTGKPFWSAMGFKDSGKIDPDNKLPIYIKSIFKDN